MGADRAEAFDHGNAAPGPRWQRRAPARRLGGRIKHPHGARIWLQVALAEFQRIGPCRVGEFVHEAFVVEPVLRCLDRSPAAGQHMGLVLGQFTLQRVDIVGEVAADIKAVRLGKGGVPGGDLAIAAQRRTDRRRALRPIGALGDFLFARPDHLDRPGALHRQLHGLIDDFDLLLLLGTFNFYLLAGCFDLFDQRFRRGLSIFRRCRADYIRELFSPGALKLIKADLELMF